MNSKFVYSGFKWLSQNQLSPTNHNRKLRDEPFRIKKQLTVSSGKSHIQRAIWFAPHWLHNQREIFKPFTEHSNRDRVITFYRHLKTDLRTPHWHRVTLFKQNHRKMRVRLEWFSTVWHKYTAGKYKRWISETVHEIQVAQYLSHFSQREGALYYWCCDVAL